MVEACPQQAIMRLTGICLIDGFALNETFDNHEQVIEDGNAKRQYRYEERQYGSLLERTVKGDYG